MPAPEVPGYQASESGKGAYTRVVPAKYTGIGDTFMGELVSKYAVEGGKGSGTPNGNFWFEYDGARDATK